MSDLFKTTPSLEKNSRITIVKTAIKPGQKSKVKVGTSKTGTLAVGIQKGVPIEFRNPRRNSSYPISKIVLGISQQQGKIIIETETSFYEIR